MDLDEIGLRAGTDKCSLGHGYLRHYERLLAPLRDEPITLLEIGVARGASVRMWESWLPTARIVAIDINPNARQHASDRSAIEIGSQDDPTFLAEIGRRYRPHVVLDDGSHQAAHILASFDGLLPWVQAGGWYIVEDIAFATAVAAMSRFTALAADLPGGIDHMEFWRSGLAVQKARVPEPDPIGARRRAVEETDLPEMWCLFATMVLRRRGDPAEAIAAARRAITQEPMIAPWHDTLSRAFEAAGDRAGALASAREAARLNAHFKERLAKLEESP